MNKVEQICNRCNKPIPEDELAEFKEMLEGLPPLVKEFKDGPIHSSCIGAKEWEDMSNRCVEEVAKPFQEELDQLEKEHATLKRKERKQKGTLQDREIELRLWQSRNEQED